MLCERCKIREANIQYTEVINGVKTEHNFCSQCAKEMDFGPYSAIFDGEFPLAKLLSGLLDVEQNNQKEEKLAQIACPTCKTTYAEFVKNSRFGCADCYSVFDPLISENIKQLQGSTVHKGKRPLYQGESFGEAGAREFGGNENIDQQLRDLDIRLKNALKQEEYEVAAQCRDRIKELKERKNVDA